MHFSQLSLVLFSLFLSILALDVKISLKTYKDGSFGYVGTLEQGNKPDPTPQQMDKFTIDAFRKMQAMAVGDAKANNKFKDKSKYLPTVMAGLHVPKKGLVFHSSFRSPTSKGTVATAALVEKGYPHRHDGVCAEFGAVAYAKSIKWDPIKSGSQMTAVRLQADGTAVKHVPACSDTRDSYGCHAYMDSWHIQEVGPQGESSGNSGHKGKGKGHVRRFDRPDSTATEGEWESL